MNYHNDRLICRHFLFLLVVLAFAACDDQEGNDNNVDDSANTYTLKTCTVNRTQLLNECVFAIDFVHGERSSDTLCTKETGSFYYDLVFKDVMVYELDENGDTIWCDYPAIYLYNGDGDFGVTVKAYQAGTGTSYFNSFIYVSPVQESELLPDYAFNLDTCKDANGNYVKSEVMAVYSWLTIGNSFNPELLDINGSQSEQDVQPVFLIKTREGLFVKFMITYYQHPESDELATLLKWKVFEE